MLVTAALLSGCGTDTEAETPAPTSSSTGSAQPGTPPVSPRSSASLLPRNTQEPPGSDHAQPAAPPAAPPLPQAASLASRFAAVWARPQISADQWWRDIAPLCEPRFAALLRSVDPANIPASKITGSPRPANQKPGLVTYTVTTDAGALTVTIAALNGRWQVTNNDFRRSGP